MPKMITSHDVLEPLKQALSASRDVTISGQKFGSKLQRVFTLGDGCWLPIKKHSVGHFLARALGHSCKLRPASQTQSSRTKKGHKHKEFGQKPPSQTPPQGPPDPGNSLFLGPLFPSKYRKKAYIENFERGGVLGAPKFFMLNFFACFFRYRQKMVFSEKASAIARMRRKCVRNASNFIGKEEQNCVKNARNTFGGEHLLDDTAFVRKCPSTVPCTVPSRESPNFRWIPSWELN